MDAAPRAGQRGRLPRAARVDAEDLRLAIALRGWAEGRDAFVGVAPIDVRFGPGRILQPDAFVVLARVALDHRGPLDRVPSSASSRPDSSNGGADRRSRSRTMRDVLTSPLLPGLGIDVPRLFAT